MAAPSDLEQYALEMINRMRTDPAGEYDRLLSGADSAQIASALSYFGVSLTALEAQLDALVATHPLAWNDALNVAASGHNDVMIAQDMQDHVLPGELGVGARLEAAGYTNWNTYGENIFAYSRSGFYGHAGLVVDWGYDAEDFDAQGNLKANWQTLGDGIQDGAGHRVNLMNADFTEIGIAITEEDNPATRVGPLVMTQDLGNRFGYKAQFVGTVIDDLDGDDFYDPGEGLGGVTVTVRSGGSSWSTTTWSSGGYQIAVPAGNYTITFSGGGLPGDIVVNAALGSVNAYLAVQADDVGVGVTRTGTAGNDTLDGTAFADILDGRAGTDTMRGFAGDDLYHVDNAGDRVLEDAGGGIDTVRASVNHTLAAYVEKLELSGSATYGKGNALDNVIIGTAGLDNRLHGEGGKDTLFGQGRNDMLVGGGGRDVIWARGGDDLLYGGSGNDRLFGQAGNDDLQGGVGRDRLDGGAGLDTFTGGSGADSFIFDDGHFAGTGYASADRIVDFSAAEGDRIWLSAVDADTAAAGDQAFTFIGRSSFSGTAGELRYLSNGVNTLVVGDVDGDGAGDFAIRLDGSASLTAAMFLL